MGLASHPAVLPTGRNVEWSFADEWPAIPETTAHSSTPGLSPSACLEICIYTYQSFPQKAPSRDGLD